jgi:NuA3 HAT complex component NTO1
MWIPEVSLGNHTFMEPVMEVEKVPKSRWKLTCYICNQQMGACIQCGNKSCYQAFHVTCARRAKLFLRMKNSQGALDVLEGSTNLKALCDKHCPTEYSKENGVARATKRAKKFYRKTMRDRIWASSQASAMELAATHRNAVTEHPPDESQMTGAKLSAVFGDQKKGQAGKPIWKLPSGAPIIPQAVFDIVDSSLQRFSILKRREFVSDACRYWTLKREMRRGAALLKRLQLQMETFSSMELTRRNFAAMGPSGKTRLTRRIEFAETLIKDLEQLQAMSLEVMKREELKLEQVKLQQNLVDTCYFPIHKALPDIMAKAFQYVLARFPQEKDETKGNPIANTIFRSDSMKNVFQDELLQLQNKVDDRFYTTTLVFAHDLCEAIHVGINSEYRSQQHEPPKFESVVAPTTKSDFTDVRERKKLGKRILKMVQPMLEQACRLESTITSKPFDDYKKELEGMLEASIELQQNAVSVAMEAEPSKDVIMVGASNAEITVAGSADDDEDAPGEDEDPMDVVMTESAQVPAKNEGNINVNVTAPTDDTKAEDDAPLAPQDAAAGTQVRATTDEPPAADMASGSSLHTPPETNGYVTAPHSTQPGPPTPPQSNGSLGQEQTNVLTDGGIPWYLKGFEPEGTSVLAENTPEADVDRAVSEELTEMDEDELRNLGLDINDAGVTASPVSTTAAETRAETSAASVVKKTATKAKKRRPTTYRGRR